MRRTVPLAPAMSTPAARPGPIRLRWPPAPAVVLVAIAVCTGWFCVVSLWRWNHLEAPAFDLAIFDQVIWNTAHGRWWETTVTGESYLGDHMSPVLLLFVPAYWLGASPVFLLLVQEVAAAAAAAPLFAAARRLGLAPAVAAALALAYLLNPYLHRAVAFDFHPEVMLPLVAFASAWAIAARHPLAGAVLALATLAFKEDAVFVALALAAMLAWRGYRLAGAATAMLALAQTAYAIFVVMPAWREPGAESQLIERYAYLAPGHADVLRYLALHPWRAIPPLLERPRLETIGLFLAVTAPVALVRPWTLLATLPGLALAVLSTHDAQRHLQYHYAIEAVPVALLAAALGAASVQRRVPGRWLAALILAPAVVGAFWLSPLLRDPGSAPSEGHVAVVEAALAGIPDGAPVSAQSGILPRLSQREAAFEFPAGTSPGEAAWVVVDRFSQRSGQSVAAGFDRQLANVRRTWTRTFARDGVEVYESPIIDGG